MNFNKQTLKIMRQDIDSALEAVAKKHGVSFKLGNIRYTGSDFRTKLECFAGDASDAAQQAFERDAWRVGVKKTAFGQTFTQGNITYKITGINTRAKKYPIKAESMNRGKRYKFPVSSLPANLRS